MMGRESLSEKRENDLDFIEFTALINIRPSLGCKSMEIQDPLLQE